MATKPTLTKMNAFDATVGTTFTFGWKGVQAFYNELIIRDSETLAVVYRYKIKTMALRHEMNVTAGGTYKFVNGKQYQATLTIYDKNNTVAGTSDAITFWCFSSPSFVIENFDTNDNSTSNQVTMSSFYLNLLYTQSEGEPLKEYSVSLYDVGRNLLTQSPIITVSSTDESLVYKIEGLANESAYYVKADGVTHHGISVTTGYVLFSVRYDRMGVGSTVIAKNIGDGTISVTSNFKITNATSYPEETIYINGSEVDLTEENYYVNFHGGFNISGDFELKATLRDLKEGNIIVVDNGSENMTVELCGFYTDWNSQTKKHYFKLTPSKTPAAFITTKLFTLPSSNKYMNLLVVSKNGYYSIDFQ